MKKDEGFTLAELLIVVAIIGVLVAISIPVFSSQLEKSREATDLANVRAAYAQIMAEAIGTENYPEPIPVKLKQKQSDWQTGRPITTLAVLLLMEQETITGLANRMQTVFAWFPMKKMTV